MTTPVLDSTKRDELKRELLKFLRENPNKVDRGIQFEGVRLDTPTPENFSLILVIKDIITYHPEYSVVQFPGGIAIVRTTQVDVVTAEASYTKINETSGHIIRGGTDKAADFENQLPVIIAGGSA